jgi:hypothetical protein
VALIRVESAQAEDAAQSLSARRAALERVLDTFATDAQNARISEAVVQTTLGVVTLVPGIVLATRHDSELRFIGTGFVVAGSVQLLTVPLLFIPSKIERLHTHLLDGPVHGESDAQFVAALETDLREEARHARAARPYVASTFTLLGVGALATGLTFLLAPPGIAGMRSNTQYQWGAVLTGVGAPYLMIGLRTFLRRTPEEFAWDLYRELSAGQTPAKPSPALSLVPTRGGAAAGLGLAF